MPSAGLTKYTGPWTKRLAAHLIRRCSFGPSADTINEVTTLGLDQTVNLLFNNARILPGPPLKWSLDDVSQRIRGNEQVFIDDTGVEYGETWLDTEVPIRTANAQDIDNYRRLSVIGREFILMQSQSINIFSKMSVFWHNHFVVGEFRLAPILYQYINTIHEEAVGNFKSLTEKMTVNIGMLLYLNGAENVKESPNENYARELLELFTLGKGEQTGPGEYTNYTENDIVEIAKVLTGWSTIPTGEFASNTSRDSFVRFYPSRHDLTTKTLSDRFDNATIPNNGEEEYKDLINIIFQQEEVSKFICRQLYIYFVHYNITDVIEQEIIEPMAQILRDDNYEIEGALKALLSSEHFLSDDAIGCMIKNPADFLMTIYKGLKAPDPESVYLQYERGFGANNLLCRALDMNIFGHPDVAGWKAYYQEPAYYRIWLNSTTLPDRSNVVSLLMNGGRGVIGQTVISNVEKIDILTPLKDLAEAPFAEDLVNFFVEHLLPNELSNEQNDYLLNLLLDGQAPSSYTDQFLDYLDNPTRTLHEAISIRLRRLITGLFSLPEIQLM